MGTLSGFALFGCISQRCIIRQLCLLDKNDILFHLTMPVEHIDFHIIGYWMTNIWEL